MLELPCTLVGSRGYHEGALNEGEGEGEGGGREGEGLVPPREGEGEGEGGGREGEGEGLGEGLSWRSILLHFVQLCTQNVTNSRQHVKTRPGISNIVQQPTAVIYTPC